MKSVAVILALALLSIGGDWLLKLASQREQPYASGVFALGAVAYGFTAVGWVIVMQHMTLAAIGGRHPACAAARRRTNAFRPRAASPPI